MSSKRRCLREKGIRSTNLATNNLRGKRSLLSPAPLQYHVSKIFHVLKVSTLNAAKAVWQIYFSSHGGNRSCSGIILVCFVSEKAVHWTRINISKGAKAGSSHSPNSGSRTMLLTPSCNNLIIYVHHFLPASRKTLMEGVSEAVAVEFMTGKSRYLKVFLCRSRMPTKSREVISLDDD